MPMTRQERVNLHTKQDRFQSELKAGTPSVSDLKEGVPVFRKVGGRIVEYVRHEGALYKKVLDKA
jgi:predicted RNA-binding protein